MTFKLHVLHVEPKGLHVRVRVFAGPDGDHQVLCGTLTMLKDEYIAFRDTLRAGVPTTHVVVLCQEQPPIEPRERRESFARLTK